MQTATVSSLKFYDCNALIGRPAIPRFFPDPVSGEVLLREMDRIGVESAVVTHVAAREYSPRVGNDLLVDAVSVEPRLTGCMTLLPDHTDELWDTAAVLNELKRRDARCVRLFPSESLHRYPLDHRVLGDLFEVLESARVPTLLDFDLGRRDEADWRALYDLADRYPLLPMIIIRPGGRSDRGLYPLLKRSPNVSVETGGYWVHRGIERICERFGAERLVYGSGFPYWTMSGAAFHVASARVSASEKMAIASGNLEALMSGVSL
ncbi:MAG: hypothetical protein JWR35_3535 [Marmoricola sp.]|nr:hypothetical protein [Marmoricola sp.]